MTLSEETNANTPCVTDTHPNEKKKKNEFRNVVQPDFTCRTVTASPERQNTHTHTHNNVFV